MKCPVLKRIRNKVGTASRIAEQAGITREAVWNWRKVPAHHVALVSRMFGIPPYKIRPDVFPPARRSRRNGKARRRTNHV